jgi:hypothetical protein
VALALRCVPRGGAAHPRVRQNASAHDATTTLDAMMTTSQTPVLQCLGRDALPSPSPETSGYSLLRAPWQKKRHVTSPSPRQADTQLPTIPPAGQIHVIVRPHRGARGTPSLPLMPCRAIPACRSRSVGRVFPPACASLGRASIARDASLCVTWPSARAHIATECGTAS